MTMSLITVFSFIFYNSPLMLIYVCICIMVLVYRYYVNDMHILSRFELLEELQKEYKNVDIELSIGDRQSILIVKGKNYNVTVLF